MIEYLIAGLLVCCAGYLALWIITSVFVAALMLFLWITGVGHPTVADLGIVVAAGVAWPWYWHRAIRRLC